VSQIVTEVQLCDTHIEYIPGVTEHPHDYNMTTENEILDPKINASANINDPTYPGHHGKMFIYKRNLNAMHIPRPDQATQSGLRFRELRQ
jgi:hypothetical protein